MNGLQKFLVGLIYENGVPSRTGLVAMLMAICPLFVWLLATLYLLFTGKTFPHYDPMTLAVFGSSAGGGILQGVNKWIISTKPSSSSADK